METKDFVELPYEIAAEDFVDTKKILPETNTNSSLTAGEEAGLILMREEEKLARDVYLALGEKWGAKVFTNIAASEATHMQAVGDLFVRYNLEDPITNDEPGVFTNSDLQKLYDDLVAKGNVSVLEAFKVGALIEDLDINDLENLLEKTTAPDVRIVYQNLVRGSENHMRAFSRQITQQGATYEPEYISEARYESILSTSQQRGGHRQ